MNAISGDIPGRKITTCGEVAESVKYAYPQNPTNAVSAIKRFDESSDSSTSQSNLERPQDIAVVGETVPLSSASGRPGAAPLALMAVCGLAATVQLGIRQTDLSMMYLLSQGEVSAISRDKTFGGTTRLAMLIQIPGLHGL